MFFFLGGGDGGGGGRHHFTTSSYENYHALFKTTSPSSSLTKGKMKFSGILISSSSFAKKLKSNLSSTPRGLY